MTENLLAIKRKSDNSFPIHEENPYTCNFLIKKITKYYQKIIFVCLLCTVKVNSIKYVHCNCSHNLHNCTT